MEVGGDRADRAAGVLSKLAITDEEQARGRLVMGRAITARRICADGMLQARVGRPRRGQTRVPPGQMTATASTSIR